MGVVPAGGAGDAVAAAGWWPASARRSGGSGGDRVRSDVGLHVVAAARGVVRAVRCDGPPPVHRVDEGRGMGQAPPPGPRRTRCPRPPGLVPLCDRLGEHAGPEKGDLTNPNPVDRGKYGSKIHLITERTGLPLSVGISGANVHDSQALIPPVKAHSPDPVPPRTSPTQARQARRQGLRLPPPAAMAGTARHPAPHRPPEASRPHSGSDDTAGPSNRPWPGSPAAADNTAATNAWPSTSAPPPASPAPSAATET